MSRQRDDQRRIGLAVACVVPLLLFVGLAAAAVYRTSWTKPGRTPLLVRLPDMPGNDDLVSTIVVFAGALLAILAVVILLLRKRPRAALFWLLAVAGALALDFLGKAAIERPSLNPT